MAATGFPASKKARTKSTAAVLAKFEHLEAIPPDAGAWSVNAARAGALAATLEQQRDRALLFRNLATLRTNIVLFDTVDELCWTGPTPRFAARAAGLEGLVAATVRR